MATDPQPARPVESPRWIGLSEEQALERLEREGQNELPSEKTRALASIALEILHEPMFLMLIGASIIYSLLGDLQETAALLVATVLIIGITLYQAWKTDHALAALRDLSSPRALVIRDGLAKRIPGRNVVIGDLILLSEGDRVAADGVLLECTNLLIDESLLTGESNPNEKVAGQSGQELSNPGGEGIPFVYSGTLVTQGRGIAEVRATGVQTQLGKIGKMLQSLKPEDTQLQRETRGLVRDLAIMGIFLCGVVAILYGYTRSSWLQGTLAGLTLAISIIPEEFPVVLTVFLAVGAWRMSRQRVLARRMPAIENLGAATVLCVDKTGTLTLNQMKVQSLFTKGESYDIKEALPAPAEFSELLIFGGLSSTRDSFDPTEQAIARMADSAPGFLGDSQARCVREYPLSANARMVAKVWSASETMPYTIAAKGAPETIARVSRLSPEELDAINSAAARMAKRGLRVLGVAKAYFNGSLPKDATAFPYQFIGLIGLADPIRPSVPGAIQECYQAGIRVVMITGDYAITAQNIGEQIGLRQNGIVLTGPELDTLSEAELCDKVRACNVFARVIPEQKLRLVNAFKQNEEVVAMTGDGVNDAPALKAANIGIAMGGRGTDFAREAADLVLLDDDFSSIVNAVRMGRRIYENLKNATAFILAIHVPIAGVALVPVILRWPLMLLPLHVLFFELVMDPACSIAFEVEPEQPDIMRRPPRFLTDRLFSGRRVGISVLQGITVLLSILSVYGLALHWGHSESDSRTLGFSSLIIGMLALIFTNRSWTQSTWELLRSPNWAFWWVVSGALIGLLTVIYVPAIRELFHLSVLHPIDLVIVILAGLAGTFWFEAMKKFGRS